MIIVLEHCKNKVGFSGSVTWWLSGRRGSVYQLASISVGGNNTFTPNLSK